LLGIAVAVGGGLSGVGVGVAIGIGVARNFIGYDPNGTKDANGSEITGYVDAPDHNVRNSVGVPSLVKDTTKVRIVDGALAGDIYQYIGPTQDDSDLTTDGKQSYDLRTQQYSDTSLWKQINLKENAGQVRAFLNDSSILATGVLTVNATATENIHAVVLALAAGIGAASGTGVAAAGAGVYAENKIRSTIKADIDGDGTAGISAASVEVKAADASSIDAVAGAVALALGFGGTAGVAVSIGLSLGFNEVDNDVQAFIINANNGVTTFSGGVTISAATQGRFLFNLTSLGSLTAADLDDAAKADQDSPDDPTNNPVILVPDDPNTVGDETVTDGGGDNPTDPTDDTVNEARQDAIADQAILVALRAAMDAQLGAQNKLAVRDTVATESVFTTESGRIALAKVEGGDQLDFNTDHSFKTGDKVIYENDGGANIGLANGTYYAIEVAGNSRAIKLAASKADAISGTAITGLTQPAAGLAGQSLRPMFEVVQGTTVKLAAGYSHGGIEGRVYRYVGAAPYVAKEVPTFHDLATENYASSDWILVDKLRVSTVEAGKSWVVIAPDGTTYLLERTSADGAPLTLSVGKNTISAVSAAASVAVGIGGTAGVAVAGAGAVAQNVILGTTKAYAQDSILNSAGDVSLSADSSSAITSTVLALAAAVGGGQVGVGASIGIAVARNFIGWVPGADAATAMQVQAYLEDSPVTAAGDLSLKSLADQTISSFVLAGSVAVGVGVSGAGIAASGSGVFSENRIGVDVESAILGTGLDPVLTDVASVTLNADNTSYVTAFAGAISVAVGAGVGVGGALSIGVSIASNTIDSEVEAIIDGADVTAQSGSVTVSATDAATIHAVAAAASVAAGIGGTVGVGIAGAGALAQNTIYGGTTARISHSDVASFGSVTVHAEDTSHIDAIIVAAAIGVGVGVEGGGIGASIGVALARNLIGGALDTDPTHYSDAYLSTANVLTLRPGDKVRVVSGPRTGDVYQYLGTVDVPVTYKFTTADTSGQLVTGDRVLRPGAGGAEDAVYEYVGKDPLDLSSTSLATQDYTTVTKWRQVTALQQDYSNPDAWKLLNVNRTPLEVKAFVEDSSILTGGALSISAKGEQTIDAFVLAGSVAIAGGGLLSLGASAAGAGAAADNRITTDVAAFIDGDRTGGISATAVSITASNLSHIHSDTAAVSVAAAFTGGASLAISIGVSLATNLIDSTVDAYIGNADVTARTGDITVSATEDASIEAVSVAASLAVSVSLIGIGISGAGAMADNTILGKTNAHATHSELDASGDVSFAAQDTSKIDATIVSASVAIGVGVLGGLGIAIGAGVSRNLIGYQPDGTSDAVEVMADTVDTGITAGGDLTLSAISQQSIH
ncbi:MAG: hypothetical protein ACRDUB_03375, partial [Mycobacterium sp.]